MGAPLLTEAELVELYRSTEVVWRHAPVTGYLLEQPTTWSTDRGDTLETLPGSWMLTDGIRSWGIAGELFHRQYRPALTGQWIKITPARAVRMDRSFAVGTLEGTASGVPGDWLLFGDAGEVWPVSHAGFVAGDYRSEPPARTGSVAM